MRKVLICSLILLAMTLCIGCKSSGISGSAANQTSNGRQSFVVDDATSAEVNRSLYLVSEVTSNSMSKATEDGFYELYPIYENGVSILYTDFASKQTVFLSNQVNAFHGDETDTSFVSPYIGGCEPFIVGNQLFVRKFSVAYDSEEAATYGDDALANIIVMDLNGANRRTLLTLRADENFLPNAIASDDKSLFCIILKNTASGGEVQWSRELVQISLSDGSVTYLKSYPAGDNCFILGTLGDKLVMKKLFAGDAKGATGEDGYQNEFGSQKHELYVYDVITGEQKMVKEWSQNDLYGVVSDGCFNYFQFSDSSVWKLNLETGEESLIATLPRVCNPEFTFADYIYDITPAPNSRKV